MTEVVVFSDGFMEFKIIIVYLIIKKKNKQTIFGETGTNNLIFFFNKLKNQLQTPVLVKWKV